MHDIRFYKDPSGVQPAKEYIKKIQNQKGKTARIQAKQIASYIQLLAKDGFALNKNYIDKINLLHAFPKKTQKTPQREIDQAIREVKDLREKGLRED
ncbi:MAG: type II toxin-antitoxin system RelE/ParE family toxin [Clostridia bacterium]|nr:type II toxin-antitoxin system RelE/ParE family toxin [Clostridia bacterium]